MSTWYNDIEPFACDVIRANIARGRLPAGTIDERSIADIRAADVRGHAQCHFFAGIGGMAYGLRLAGWPDDLPVWTGGFPCQDVSVAGRGAGLAGARSGLWYEWLRLIDECRPDRLLIENVPALRTRGADDVLAALDARGYATWPLVVGAELAGAHHKRNRVWMLARNPGTNPSGLRSQRVGECPSRAWSDEQFERLVSAEVQFSIPAGKSGGVSDGVSARIHQLRGLGNAVVPQVVAAVAQAWLDVME